MFTEPGVDFAVEGQGEEAVCLLGNALNGDNPQSHFDQIPRLWYRQNGQVRKAATPSKRLRASDLPSLVLNNDLLNLERYINPETRALNYNASFGCVGQCSFCFWPDNYHYERLDNSRILEELKYLIRTHRLRNISFDDPTFFVNRRVTMELVDSMIADRLKVRWRANGRVDTLKTFSPADFDRIIESGCHLVHVGMESGSQRMLDLMRKNIRVKDGLDLIRKCLNKNIQLRFHFILGNPTETLQDIEQTADFIRTASRISKRFDYTINIFTPYPGNALTDLAGQFGYSPPGDLEGYKEIEILNFKMKDSDPDAPVPSIWNIEYKLPWFSPEFNRQHREMFHRLIPEKKSIVSTDNKIYTFSSANRKNAVQTSKT